MSLSTARKRINKPSAGFAKLLQEHHSDLREWLNVTELIPLLRKQELLTVEEWEQIGKQSRSLQIDQLIRILPQKGEMACSKFICCLESEKEHPAHKELAVKLKRTEARCHRQQVIRNSTTDSDVTKTDLKGTRTIKLMEQVTELLHSELVGVDEMMNCYEERIASLQAQLAEKEKIITKLPQGNAEVTYFQQLLDYVNTSHAGSQASLHYNTQVLAKYYHDCRKVLKTVKMLLKRDNNRVNHYLDAASEDSDSMRSRASSMGSELQLNNFKIQKPSSKQSIEEEKEPVEEENKLFEEDLDRSSSSSADETDDENLNAPEEHQFIHQVTKALRNQQRPSSWPHSRKRRAVKTTSHPLSSAVTTHVKRDDPSTDANEDSQVLAPCVAIAEENEKDFNENASMACSNVDQSSMEDQEESSCTVFAGYLQKEGDGELWRKRYFMLTKEFLLYSKSEQDSRPIGLIPLIDLALEKKRKNSFEVINKRTSLIKVKKPGKKHVQSYKVLRLKASSEAEATQWIHSIEDAITTLRTQYLHD